jgi:N,N'-diacetyllegionaminate synthase
MKLGKQEINKNKQIFIIAEAGINYNNDLKLAYKMIDAAYFAGADAIKFQTWVTDKMQLKNSKKPNYQKDIKIKTYYQTIKDLEPSFIDQKKLFDRCKKRGITFLSTPYDKESVDFLDKTGIVGFKIASSDLTNHQLLKHISKKKKPIILSTGLSTLSDVKKAVKIIKNEKMLEKLILMQTTSNYPTPHEDVNLQVIPEYIKMFKVPVGFSDHTIDNVASLGSVALGACILEKHFTLNKKLKGPDQKASLDIHELKDWIKNIRIMEKCLGISLKILTNSDKKNLTMRKILVINPILKGQRINKESLTAMRGNAMGILPTEENIKKIIDKKIKLNIKKSSQFSWKMI